MRPLALLLLALSLTAAELEQITLADGRRFVGYYDADAGTVTIEGPPKAVIRVKGSEVTSRAAYIRPPESDAAKRDEAELVRLEAEHAAAVAEAARLRKFAGSRSGKEAETATAQANARAAEAEGLAAKMAAMRAKMAAAKATPAPVAILEEKPTEPAKPKVSESAANAALRAAITEALEMRDKAIRIEFDAYLAWLEAQDLTPKAPPRLGDDPRKSEVEAVAKINEENRTKEHKRSALDLARRCKTIEQKEEALEKMRWTTHNLMPEISPERQKNLDEANAEAAILSGYQRPTKKR